MCKHFLFLLNLYSSCYPHLHLLSHLILLFYFSLLVYTFNYSTYTLSPPPPLLLSPFLPPFLPPSLPSSSSNLSSSFLFFRLQPIQAQQRFSIPSRSPSQWMSLAAFLRSRCARTSSARFVVRIVSERKENHRN